ncbi:unnamed protein product (macronuclear) [Paramecium tetraurelia]|uniref:Transmembrane protein n=1 Tax=Paramecium tetraurelia TaxID=5888 RepID=A0DPL7_PARTE|nr:uncharacterized protein GSPATT00019166001 [Paramecium tetraurelia]CAK84984.1 unnamed protein product [Paramecium tetraurelia]|eukprot:XP_001452381.1 hypothetical protein (macronuclear) [Paramecium tetraurelia strain d4-2]
MKDSNSKQINQEMILNIYLRSKLVKLMNIKQIRLRLLTTINGYENVIRCVIKLNNGDYATSSRYKTIKIWNQNNFECSKILHEYLIIKLLVVQMRRILRSILKLRKVSQIIDFNVLFGNQATPQEDTNPMQLELYLMINLIILSLLLTSQKVLQQFYMDMIIVIIPQPPKRISEFQEIRGVIKQNGHSAIWKLKINKRNKRNILMAKLSSEILTFNLFMLLQNLK